MAWDDDFEIKGRVPRNAEEEILIKTGKYWNIEIIDVRWFKNGKPTRKGIRFNKGELKHVSNILRRLADGEHKGSKGKDKTDTDE